MRSKTLVLLAVLLGSAAAFTLLLPRGLERVARNVIQEYFTADFRCASIERLGWSGVRIVRPSFHADGRMLLSADEIELRFDRFSTDARLTFVRVKAPEARMSADDLGRLLADRGGRSSPVAFDFMIEGGTVHLGEERATIERVEGRVEAGRGKTHLVIVSGGGMTPLGPIAGDGKLEWNGSSLGPVEGRAELAGVPWTVNGDAAIRFETKAPRAEAWNGLLDRFMELVRGGSAATSQFHAAQIGRLALTTEFDGRWYWEGEGLVAAAYPVEILSARGTASAGGIGIDSITARIPVGGESAVLAGVGGLLRTGHAALGIFSGSGAGFDVRGRELTFSDGKIAAVIERFEGEIEGAHAEASGDLSGDPADPGFRGRFRLRGWRIQGGDLDLAGKADLARIFSDPQGSVDVEGGRMRRGGALFTILGTAARREQSIVTLLHPLRLTSPGLALELTGAIDPSGPLRSWLDRLSVVARLESATLALVGRPDVTLESGIADLRAGERFRLEAAGVTHPEGGARRISATGEGLSLAEARVRRLAADCADVTWNGWTVSAAHVTLVDTRVERAVLEGPSADPWLAALESGAVRIERAGEGWSGPMEVSIENGGLVVTEGELLGPTGTARVSGIFGAGRTEFDAEVSIDLATAAGIFMETAPWATITAGKVKAVAHIRETASVTIEITGGSALVAGMNVGELESRIRYEAVKEVPGSTSIFDGEGQWRIERLQGRTEAGEFTLAGSVASRGGRPVKMDLSWRSRGFELRALRPLHRVFEGVNGRADAELIIQGAVDAPRISGHAVFSGASLSLGGIGTVESLIGRVEFAGGSLRITSLEGTLGGGPVKATGEWSLGSDGGGEIRGSVQRAKIRPLEGVEATIDGDFLVDRTGAGRPRLSGIITARQARFLIQQYQTAVAQSGRLGEPNLDLDIAVRVESLRMTGADLMVDLASEDLHLGGTDASPGITGTLSGSSGRFLTRSAAFRIRQARIVLPEVGEVTIAAQAAARIGRIKILADVTGPVSDYRVALSSEPPRSEEDLVRLLALGGEPAPTGDAAGIGFGAVTHFALPIANTAGGELGEGIGLDYLRLEKTEGDTGNALFNRVTLGGYVSDRLYLGYSQGTDRRGEQSVEMEFEVNPELYMRFEAGSRGTAGAGFEWRRDY